MVRRPALQVRTVACLLALSGVLGACASAKVRNAELARSTFLEPPPPVVFIEKFTLGYGLVGGKINRKTADRVLSIVAEHSVEELRSQGYPAERGPASMNPAQAPPGAVFVSGEITDVDRGNGWGRVLIGFGLGASRLDARVVTELSQRPAPERIYEFDVNAHGGRLPGLIVPLGLGKELALLINGLGKAAGELSGPLAGDARRTGEAIGERLAEIFRALQWPGDRKG